MSYMSKNMDNVSMFWLLFVIIINSGYCMQRTLRSWVNPDCGTLCKDQNLTTIYLRADGPNDTLHYLWDFGGKPSVLLALTPPATSLNINWGDFLLKKANSIRFSEEPVYTFGIVINKVIEFNDVNDTGLINTANNVNINVLHPEFFHWERKVLSQSNDFVALNMKGNSYEDLIANISRGGSVKLSLRGFCTLDHSEIVPHMLHTENSTQIDIILDDIETNQTFSNSRFAIELLVVGGGNPDIPMFINSKKSLDDEHTPGIFEVVEVRTPPFKRMNNFQSVGAYLQWRPVSYTSSSRDIGSLTETIQYPPRKVSQPMDAVNGSMLYCYYGNEINSLLVQKMTVSLGMKDDGFYKKSRYSTWTFLIGYGTPPDEQFSYLVIMIISIGLGLPIIIMFGAGLYLCIRRMPKQNSELYINR